MARVGGSSDARGSAEEAVVDKTVIQTHALPPVEPAPQTVLPKDTPAIQAPEHDAIAPETDQDMIDFDKADEGEEGDTEA